MAQEDCAQTPREPIQGRRAPRFPWTPVQQILLSAWLSWRARDRQGRRSVGCPSGLKNRARAGLPCQARALHCLPTMYPPAQGTASTRAPASLLLRRTCLIAPSLIHTAAIAADPPHTANGREAELLVFRLPNFLRLFGAALLLLLESLLRLLLRTMPTCPPLGFNLRSGRCLFRGFRLVLSGLLADARKG